MGNETKLINNLEALEWNSIKLKIQREKNVNIFFLFNIKLLKFLNKFKIF